MGVLLILIACLLWAVDTLIRFPLIDKGNHPITIVFFEHLILTLIFLPRTWNTRSSFSDLRVTHFLCFFILGAGSSAIATVAFTKSFLYLNPSLVILLQKFQPVLGILLAALILKEPIPKPFIFWTLVCLMGGFLIGSSDLIKFYELYRVNPTRLWSEGALEGYFLVLISIVGWGAGPVFGKVLTTAGYSSKGIMQGRFLIGLMALVAFVPWNGKWYFVESLDYVRTLLMVIISGLMAMYFYYQGLQKISAKYCAIMEMFFPFFAVIVNWIFLNQHLNLVQITGGILLVGGAFVLQIKRY